MKIKGEVILGDGYGNTIGFPTANIDSSDYLSQNTNLKHGVYVGFVNTDTKSYRAGIVIGPDDDADIPKLEAHLIDFTGDLYGSMVTFHIIKYIRPSKFYSSEKELKTAIANDIELIKKMNLCLPE
jgi:riboflavin kinase/FMN adenylyltransferase